MVGGVASGVAQWLRIDPVLVRVAFVVLAVFGGSGLVLYAIGWLFIPEVGRDQSAAQRVLGDHQVVLWVAAIVGGLLLLGLVGDALSGGPFPDNGPFGVILLLAVIAVIVVVVRRPDSSDDGPVPGAAGPVADRPVAEGTMTASAATPPPAPRERSLLGRLTISVLALVIGVLVALDFVGALDLTVTMGLAAALAVVGAGLVVGGFVGRSRGLIAWGVLLVLVLVPVSAFERSSFSFDRNGELYYRPPTVAAVHDSYTAGVGGIQLDLTKADPAGTMHDVAVQLGVGDVTLYVPEDVTIEVAATVGAGTVQFPKGGSDGGTNVDQTYTHTGPADVGGYRIDAQVGLGQIEVIAL